MGKRLVAILVVLVLAFQAGPAAAQDPGSTSTTAGEITDTGIIPEPNAGEEPNDPGDRGGTLQLVVLGLVVVAIGGVVFAVARQSRRARGASG
jgi:hypothetical protein